MAATAAETPDQHALEARALPHPAISVSPPQGKVPESLREALLESLP